MPGEAERQFRQAQALARSGRLPEAAQALQAVTRAAPGFFPAQRLLGQFAFRLGNFDLAVQALEQALALQPADEGCQLALAEILRRAIPQGYQPALDARLTTLLSGDTIKHQDLALVTARHLKLKHPLPAGLEALLGDPLLHLLLTRCVLVDGELELTLTDLRREILLDGRKLPRGLLIALATQTANNNAAWFVSPEEAAEIASRIETLPPEPNDSELWPLLLYRPLAALPQAEALAARPLESWPADLQPLVRFSLTDPLEARRRAEAIPRLDGETSDAVSEAVREQYEESPYPRWLHLERFPAAGLAERLRQLFPGFQPAPALDARPLPLLVPGGGTGRQPLSLARAFPETRVLALDLSRASLGYARQRAEELGIGNVEFLQGDLLDLGRLGRRFPAIACTGVLHHLAEPLAGWRVLTELLEPGGVMQVALYSRRARRDIALARERIAALGLGDTLEDIRAFRRRVLGGEEPELAHLSGEKDFADLHGCRDLLFHRQEHRFDLAEIAAMLDELGLEFLGFDLAGPEIARAYAAANPQDPGMTDLAAWQAFEEANPSAFRTMYNFWCRKPAAEDGR